MFFRRYCYIYNSRNYRSLLAKSEATDRNLQIYNSRNYRSLLAILYQIHRFQRSTIVDIIEAYQPFSIIVLLLLLSTIVEIIEAYQPPFIRMMSKPYLQQQKLQKLTSHRNMANEILNRSTIVEIIEAYQPSPYVYALYHKSTIVEIIEAYQPAKASQHGLN